MKLARIIWLPGLALVALLSALGGCSDKTPVSSDLQRSEGQLFDTIIRCGALIDGISDEPLGRRDIALLDGRVLAIEAADSIPHDTGSSVLIDLSEMTCLPGLINTHVHFDGNPEDSADYGIYARRTADETLQLVLDNAKTTLLTGFTTVRHVGAWFPDTIYRARALIEQGRALGPRIQTAGPYLTIP
ncbi:MAG: amidohydrolase family protein, partial [Proteobacteria bacterium]|nr:amidohydrolase family protein [Pseudomonadota bacterium]